MQPLIYETLTKQRMLLESKEISSVELTKAYLDQIERTDDTIGAFLHVDATGALRSA